MEVSFVPIFILLEFPDFKPKCKSNIFYKCFPFATLYN